MKVFTASEKHLPEIRSIAHLTWHKTYASIISEKQISYMLELFYADAVLSRQMSDPLHHFSVALLNDTVVGYSHCIEDENEPGLIKLSKLYILPDSQGLGIGRLLMQHVAGLCRRLKKHSLILNVNRHNPAVEFYQRMGFEIVRQVDIPLGEFWLNDYIMQKKDP